MNDKLKKIIFGKLCMNLSKVEIINYGDSIWFIDRANKYWYFEYEKSGILWWRYDFFEDFFPLFSMEEEEYEPLIIEWVEGILNCGNITESFHNKAACETMVNYMLTRSSKVLGTLAPTYDNEKLVDKVLEYGVREAYSTSSNDPYGLVNDMLNCRVGKTIFSKLPYKVEVDRVLNHFS